MVGYLIISLLLIVHRIHQIKDFENWLKFGKDINNHKVGHFLGYSVVLLFISSKYLLVNLYSTHCRLEACQICSDSSSYSSGLIIRSFL